MPRKVLRHTIYIVYTYERSLVRIPLCERNLLLPYHIISRSVAIVHDEFWPLLSLSGCTICTKSHTKLF